VLYVDGASEEWSATELSNTWFLEKFFPLATGGAHEEFREAQSSTSDDFFLETKANQAVAQGDLITAYTQL
jgi:hypothetical protein